MYQMPWDHQIAVMRTLAVDVGKDLGEPDGVIVFDPSVLPRKVISRSASASNGAVVSASLRTGQVGVYMAYVTRKEHAIVNERLYLSGRVGQGLWPSQRARCAQVDQVLHPPSAGFGLLATSKCRTLGSRATMKWGVLLVAAFPGLTRDADGKRYFLGRPPRKPGFATLTRRRQNTRDGVLMPSSPCTSRRRR